LDKVAVKSFQEMSAEKELKLKKIEDELKEE
jgi:hypothetical protein